MTDKQYCQEALRMADFSDDVATYKKVGAIIVLNHEIIGRGFRKTLLINNIPYIDICFHAEHVAIASSGYRCEGAALYTTMEPCSKRNVNQYTLNEVPDSCSNLIVKYRLDKVVFIDRDLKSSSKSFLIKNGIDIKQIRL